jgi:hypothetical protein
MQLIFHEFFSFKFLGHTSHVGVMARWCPKFDVQSHKFSRLCLLMMNGVPMNLQMGKTFGDAKMLDNGNVHPKSVDIFIT